MEYGKYKTRREKELGKVINDTTETVLKTRKETEYQEGITGKRPPSIGNDDDTGSKSKRSKSPSTGAGGEDEDMIQNIIQPV